MRPYLIQAAGCRRHHDYGYSDEQRDRFTRSRSPNKATTPLLRSLFDRIDADGSTFVEIEKKSGVLRTTISLHRRGKVTPRLDIFEAVANAAGYDVVLVKKEKTR